MKLLTSAALLLAPLALCGTKCCLGALPYVETFPSGGAKSGWYLSSDGGSGGTNEVNNRFEFVSTNCTYLSLDADPGSSNGAFVGNYLSVNISRVTFDLQVAQGSTFNSLSLDLEVFATNTLWRFNLIPSATGVLTNYSVPLPPNGSGWTLISGSESFSSTLSHVSRLSINPRAAGAGNISGYLDNVAAVPEPSASLTFLLGGVLLGRISTRRRSVK